MKETKKSITLELEESVMLWLEAKAKRDYRSPEQMAETIIAREREEEKRLIYEAYRGGIKPSGSAEQNEQTIYYANGQEINPCNNENGEVIEICRRINEVPEFSVKVNGKEIENMRSFEIRVSNEIRSGVHESPYYNVEQYFHGQREAGRSAERVRSGEENDEREREMADYSGIRCSSCFNKSIPSVVKTLTAIGIRIESRMRSRRSHVESIRQFIPLSVATYPRSRPKTDCDLSLRCSMYPFCARKITRSRAGEPNLSTQAERKTGPLVLMKRRMRSVSRGSESDMRKTSFAAIVPRRKEGHKRKGVVL